MADEYRLVDLLGRLGDGDFHFLGLIEDACGELLYLFGHCCREHERLAVGRQFSHYAHNIFVEAHVEHAVGFIEDKVLYFREVDVSHFYVGEETSGVAITMSALFRRACCCCANALPSLPP